MPDQKKRRKKLKRIKALFWFGIYSGTLASAFLGDAAGGGIGRPGDRFP